MDLKALRVMAGKHFNKQLHESESWFLGLGRWQEKWREMDGIGIYVDW